MKKYPIALSDEYVDRIVASIVSVVPAEQIYVFGSYARGEEREGSDVDLYVVVGEACDRFRSMDDIAYALLWMDRPKDVVVRSGAQFEVLKNSRSTVEYGVRHEGVLVYSR